MLTIGDFNSFWAFLGHPVLINPCLEVENFTSKTTPKRGPKRKHQKKSMNKVCKLAATKHRHKTMSTQKIFQSKNFPLLL